MVFRDWSILFLMVVALPLTVNVSGLRKIGGHPMSPNSQINMTVHKLFVPANTTQSAQFNDYGQ